MFWGAEKEKNHSCSENGPRLTGEVRNGVDMERLLIHPQSIQICISLQRFQWERAPLETLLGKLLLHRGTGNVLIQCWAGL